jgi:hypothetical protein
MSKSKTAPGFAHDHLAVLRFANLQRNVPPKPPEPETGSKSQPPTEVALRRPRWRYADAATCLDQGKGMRILS